MSNNKMNLDEIVAIDVHTHAEVSCRQPHDDYRPEFDEAFAKFLKQRTAYHTGNL
jgi:hypothetical protein